MNPVRPRETAGDDTSWGDAELAHNRPVAVGVDYKVGESGGKSGTDHWICLTRRDPDDPSRYYANDPATGAEISLRRLSDGRLFADQATEPYVTSGEFVTSSLAAADRRGRL